MRRLAALVALAMALALGGACTTAGKTPGATSSGSTVATTTGTGGHPTGSGTGGGAGTGGSGASATMFCAPATVDTSPAGASAFTVKTAHYQLYAEVSQDRATEMGRLLEAAYLAFQAWFQATPPAAEGLLQVKFYADEPAWASGLGADGIVAPAEAGGYYAPTTRTAYLFEQGNPYYSHVLLVHEATHQFHERSRTKGQTLPFWYAEGHAEYLSRHDWDDHCIRLGVTPLLSWEDMAGQALAESTSPGIDVAAVVSGTPEASRPASWAVFRYLDTGAHHDGFRAFRDAFDANLTDPAHSFAALVGDPAALSAPLSAWLPGAQEPMKPIFTEWVHTGPHAVFGDSLKFFSLATLKNAVTHFEARYDVPSASTWSAGVVLGYKDDQNYEALVVSPDGKLRTFTATAGNALWHDAGTAPASTGGEGAMAVDFGAGGMVTVTVNGAVSTHPIGGLPAAAGLAISDSQVAFHDVSWK